MSREFETRREQQQEELAEVLKSLTYALNESSKSKTSTELQGANAIAFACVAGAVDGRSTPTKVQNVLLGWSVRESSGVNPATVIFRDGGNSGDDEVASITLNAGESTRDLFPFGISLVKGLFLDVQLGAIAGAVYLGNA